MMMSVSCLRPARPSVNNRLSARVICHMSDAPAATVSPCVRGVAVMHGARFTGYTTRTVCDITVHRRRVSPACRAKSPPPKKKIDKIENWSYFVPGRASKNKKVLRSDTFGWGRGFTPDPLTRGSAPGPHWGSAPRPHL